jgi:serine/threonine protein kinase
MLRKCGRAAVIIREMTKPRLDSDGYLQEFRRDAIKRTFSNRMIDRYKILESLGEGGAGTVKKAWDKKLQRYVALKLLLPPEQREQGGAGTDLEAEAAALSALQHPNIVSVYDLDTDGEEPFVVMEFINGENLEETVRRGALMPADFYLVATETLEGLNAAHKQGIAHRDIKPGNVMVHWMPNGSYSLKLLDFGLAKYSSRPAQQQVQDGQTVAGSVHFMAPEQFLHQPLDLRSDLYSLGCVFYYALTGSFPFQGESAEAVINAHLARQVSSLHELRADIDPLLCDWVMWLMSRQQEERPTTAAEALRVLEGIKSGELTSLPSRRALRTQQLPTGATKGSAPVKPTPATGPTQPGVTSAKLSPTGSVLPTSSVASPKRSPLPWLLGAGAVAACVGAAISLIPRSTSPDAAAAVKSDTKSGSMVREEAKPIPQAGLAIYFHESSGYLMDRGTSRATVGAAVDQWNDAGPVGGDNPAQYHKTVNAAWRSVLPTLIDAKGGGLVQETPALSFSGKNNLVFGRDRDGVGAPFAGVVDGAARSWAIVFRASSRPEKQTLISAGSETRQTCWATYVKDGLVCSGRPRSSGEEVVATSSMKAVADFHIVTVVWDERKDELRQWLTSSNGTTTASPVAHDLGHGGALDGIRIGATKPTQPGAHSEDFLEGDVIAIALYNRTLTDAERVSLTDHFSRRYFGKLSVE